MLKSHEGFPPGGWKFKQPETNWELPNPLAVTFNQAVDEIIKHRKLNPRFKLSTDPAEVDAELDRFTEKRLRSMPGTQSYLAAPDPKPEPPNPLQSAAAAVGGVAGASISAGIPVLINWLGDGLSPVAPVLAARRSVICADCPQNQPGDWRQWFTAPVAAVLRKQMEIKADMKLSTPNDGRINVCRACACELKLKVWTPLKHIAGHLTGEMRNRLDPRCWILSET